MSVCTVVLCAGKSTRMHSAHSKMLHPLCGKPMCFWVLDAALAANQGPVVAVVQKSSDTVALRITQHYGDKVTLAFQEQPKGTGHAAQMALGKMESSCKRVLVLYGDTPLLRSETLQLLVDKHKQSHALVALLTTHYDNPTGYGRIVRDAKGHVVGVVEEKQANAQQRQLREINSGVYVFCCDFIARTLPTLSFHESAQEYHLTDLVAVAQSQENQGRRSVADVPVCAQEVLGVNNRSQWATAQNILRQCIVQHWMDKGVSCVDPQRTYIDAECVLHQDIVLEPGVMLRGRSCLHQNVHVSAGCILTDCTLEQGVCVLPYSVCEGMHVQTQARIGPFARIRPETVIGKQVQVGNFVEVKASTLQQHVKVNHLAYVGNAHVGQNSNVGAGTVVCNYDGVSKHETHVGQDVFVGSNSTLVAPVRLEQGVYVAAGSVVNQDVPADSLAIARGRQCTKEGAAVALRQRLKQHGDSSKLKNKQRCETSQQKQNVNQGESAT